MIGHRSPVLLSTAQVRKLESCTARSNLDNLWTDVAGRVLLAGFTGRVADPAPPVLRSATPHTAPEVLLGEPLDPAVDVYGLGSTLYELIAGTSAIRSYAGESTAALSLRVLTGAAVRLPRSGMPFELADVIGWSMAVDRGDRPPSVAWLAEELGRIQRTQGWARTRPSVGGRAEPIPHRLRGARHRAGRNSAEDRHPPAVVIQGCAHRTRRAPARRCCRWRRRRRCR